jgi:hypothetical protein
LEDRVNDWLTFEGRVEVIMWGRATYTVLRLPADVAGKLAALGAKRVEGEMNDHPVNLALSRAPVVEGVFLWTGKSLLARLAIKPGEALEVRLRKAVSDEVDTPDDVVSALRAAGQAERWNRLTPGRRRGLLHQISTAKTAATRIRRIASIVLRVAETATDLTNLTE